MMSPDAVRLAHRARVWHKVLRRTADAGGHVLIEGCAWKVSDDDTLGLMTVRDAATRREVQVPPGLGLLVHLNDGSRTVTGETALRFGVDGLRVDVLGRQRALKDLAPDLVVLLELDGLAVSA